MMQEKCVVCGTKERMIQNGFPIDSIAGLSHIWGLSSEEAVLFNRREGLCCPSCWSSQRVLGIASALFKLTPHPVEGIKGFVEYANDNDLDVAEINSCASLHKDLSRIDGLVYSEFFDEAEQKTNGKVFDGIAHEDITGLTYRDNSFDLVLHSETLEHIHDPKKAADECLRVLRPGGVCLFTTPVIWSRKTRKTFEGAPGGYSHEEPISFHGDKDSRYPVTFEYGWDVQDYLGSELYVYTHRPDSQSYIFLFKKPGSNEKISLSGEFMKLSESLDAVKKKELEAKQDVKEEPHHKSNIELDPDGERMIPEHHSEHLFFAEHMTRYSQIRELIKGKTVLDIASGSGYGSQILAKSADRVFGVDVDVGAINYARQRYSADNLTYMLSDGKDIPLDNDSVDVVVSFETIEHIEDYLHFLKEVRRVLKDDGVFVISTPNELEYAEGNHFHIHEFEYEELMGHLSHDYKNIDSYFQSTWKAVLLAKMDDHMSEAPLVDKLQNFSPLKNEKKMLYFYLVCSNRRIESKVESVLALGVHLSEADEVRNSKRTQDYLRTVEGDRDSMSERVGALESVEKSYNLILSSRAYKLSLRLSKGFAYFKKVGARLTSR